MINHAPANIHSLAEPAHSGSQVLLALCKASSDELRLDILRVLSRDSYGVQELCSIFDCKQSGMSHHLKILANAGLVTTRREGNSIFYRRAYRSTDDALNTLQQALHQAIDQQPLRSPVQQKIFSIQQERAANSELFFSANADKFRQQQEQIAAYELYGPSAIELLARGINHRNAIAVEIGPGEGAFLAELSPRFQQVYAVDNSMPMLDKAAHFTEQRQLANITFIHGDTKHEQLQKLSVDCVVVNMVLHHTPSPADIFSDLAKVLDTDGQLYVTDLCSHDQSWVKDSCGDLWLGFEPEDLSLWAPEAGFKSGEDIYLAQRNGFRVQIRQFIKL